MVVEMHPHWGHVKDEYDSKYVYDKDKSSRKIMLSPRVLDALCDDGFEAISRLRELGESLHEPNWEDGANEITLPMLYSIMQHMACECSLLELGNPLVVRGCIKLMRSITRFGRPSPFSYEYGHLCFRILVIAFDYCVLQLSDRHEGWVAEMEEPEYELLEEGHVPMLSNVVSDLLIDCMNEGADPYYPKFFASRYWDSSYTGPLITPTDIILLGQILDDDRKHFLIYLRSNYSLPPAALFYTMFHHLSHSPAAFIQGFCRLYPRYLLTTPGNPFSEDWVDQYVSWLSSLRGPPQQFLDLEDLNLFLQAYFDRFTVLSADSELQPRVLTPLAVKLLQYVVPLVCNGCEALIPSVIYATIRCISRDINAGFPDVAFLVDGWVQLLGYITRLVQFITERVVIDANTIHAIMNVIFDERLVNLGGLLISWAPERCVEIMQSVNSVLSALKVNPVQYLQLRMNANYLQALGHI